MVKLLITFIIIALQVMRWQLNKKSDMICYLSQYLLVRSIAVESSNISLEIERKKMFPNCIALALLWILLRSCTAQDRCETFELSGRQVFVSQNNLTWQEAQQYCLNLDCHLLHIRDESENKVVSSFLRLSWLVDLWIGANAIDDRAVFRWYPGSEQLNYTNWDVDERYSNWCDDRCVTLFRLRNNSVYWRNTTCGSKLRFLCECPLRDYCGIVPV